MSITDAELSNASARPVLVTGASSGIGRAIVEFLSARGHAVFAGARKPGALDSLGHLANVTPLALDVTRPSDIEKAVSHVRDSGLGLYGLVNNAGVGRIGPLAEIPLEEVHQVLEVNLDGAHRMVNAMFPFIRESRGRIVNITSIGGFLVEPLLGPYNISKHALEAYTDVLREEVRKLGVKVIAIEPGNFRSNIFDNGLMLAGDEWKRKWAGSDSVFRDSVLEALAYFERSEVRYRTKYPLPIPVADAVTQALFTEEPKPRYLVGTPEEAGRVIDRLFVLAKEINSSHAGSLSSEDLVQKLKASLAA